MEANMTATPLHVLALYGGKVVSFCISNSKTSAKKAQQICLPRTDENVAFVQKCVRACNAHDDLVKALKAAHAVLAKRSVQYPLTDTEIESDSALMISLAALTKVEAA